MSGDTYTVTAPRRLGMRVFMSYAGKMPTSSPGSNET